MFEIERGWSIRMRQFLVVKTMDDELMKRVKERQGNIVQVTCFFFINTEMYIL